MKFIRPFLRSVSLWLILFASITAIDCSAITINQTGYTLQADAWNNVRMVNDSGEVLATFTGIELKKNPWARSQGGEIYEVEQPDGSHAIEVSYVMESQRADEALPDMLVGARFTPYPNRLEIEYVVDGDLGKPGNLNLSMMGCLRPHNAQDVSSLKVGLWKRHEYGGQPVEHLDAIFTSYRVGDTMVYLSFDTTTKVNTKWKDRGSHHIVFQSPEDSLYTASVSVLLTPAGSSPEFAAARAHQRPIGLHIDTDKTYNWWESKPGEPASEQPTLRLNAELSNTTDAPRVINYNYWVRDFAGNVVAENSSQLTLAANEIRDEVIAFQPSPESIDPSREIFFTEVQIVDAETGEEVFARTNLSLLPPHEFQDTPDESMFGLASYWLMPDKDSAADLMDRMGVRWLRLGNTHDHVNRIALLHTQMPSHPYSGSAEDDAWIRENLERCVANGNPAWEFGNELNYSVLSIGMGDVLKNEKRKKKIDDYVSWLHAIRRIQQEMGGQAAEVKILSMGLAGMDVNFVRGLDDAGGWELLDGLSLHPGRGNFTPDYPVDKPWDEWETGAYGNYWNYYGAVRTAKRFLDEIGGDKELWLTEVYVPGFPNSFWEDSLRHATENVILSFALAKAEDVKAVMWYRLFDSVWHDPLGISPNDREYFFGIIQRDMSFKPALLSFCTAAEEFDQSTFERWLEFPESETTRGLLFDTTRGPMAVLWDRSDGYVLSERTEHFASPEPWTDEWETVVPVELKVADGQDHVTVINSIGQRQSIAATNGYVTLNLTGAPLIVYGLDPQSLH